MSTWVSIVSLAVTLIATSISFVVLYNQHIESTKAQLRGIVQRLLELPVKQAELSLKFKESDLGATVNGQISREDNILAYEAANLADAVPNHVTASEYLTIAQALVNLSDLKLAEQFYFRAIEKSKTLSEQLISRGMLAGYYMHYDKIELGRAQYEAMDILLSDNSDAIVGYPTNFIHISRATMYSNRVNAEADIGDCNQAERMRSRMVSELNTIDTSKAGWLAKSATRMRGDTSRTLWDLCQVIMIR